MWDRTHFRLRWLTGALAPGVFVGESDGRPGSYAQDGLSTTLARSPHLGSHLRRLGERLTDSQPFELVPAQNAAVTGQQRIVSC
jgi:hypothetical protein